MTVTYQRTDRVPLTHGETRRKLLLQLQAFGFSKPKGPSYLITEDNEPIVFGEDRILIRKSKEI